MRLLSVSLLALVLLLGCDDTSSADAGPADAGRLDAGTTRDAGSDAGTDAGAADAGATDAGRNAGTDAGSDAGTDAGAADAGTDAGTTDAGFDAGWDAAAGCHGVGFGADAVTIEDPGSTPPEPTGGVIPLGVYDLLRVQNYGGTGDGMMRSTWEFRPGGTLATLTAAAPIPGASLPEATPRLNTWSTDGAVLSRTEICGGDAAAMVGYSVVVSGSITVLRLRADTSVGALVLTYRLRP